MGKIKEFFSLNGSFISFMEKLLWVLIINLIFIVCSLPIVTVGAAAKGMYAVMFKLVEERKLDLISTYFSAFIKNIFTSIALTVTSLVLLVVSVFNILYFFWMDTAIGYVLMTASIIIFLGILCIILCMMPILALNDGKYKETIVATLDFIKTYPVAAISILLVTIGFMVVTLLIMSIQILYIFAYLLFIMTGLCALVITYIVHSKLILPEMEEEE